jgi:hypothetical protein
MAQEGQPGGPQEDQPALEDQPGKPRGWLSETDQHLLVVTFVGTVAANLITVLFAGGAIALVRVLQSHLPPGQRAEILTIIIVGTAAFVCWNALQAFVFRAYANRKPESLIRSLLYLNALFSIVWPLLLLFLVLVGLAAGIK